MKVIISLAVSTIRLFVVRTIYVSGNTFVYSIM